MAIQGSDSIVVHRGGADYRTEASELIAGKGNIQLKQGNTELGRFNVNQSNDQLITIPESEITSINGQTGDVIIDANDLNIEFPVTSVNGMTGDVLIVGGSGDVTSVNGMTGDVTVDVPVFSVNGETGDVTVDVPIFSVNGQTGDVVVDVPINSVNGYTGDVVLYLDDLADVNTSGVTVDQLLGWDGSSWVPKSPVSLPPSSQLKGFIDVAAAAPAASAGDIWIHHKNPSGSSTAAGSWTGIAGQTIEEGTYVIYSTDNQWYSGTNANDLTQIQSDWNVTDNNDAAFIKNKPTIGDGDYSLSAGSGVYFSGDALFSANQSTDAALEIGVDSIWFNNEINSAVGNKVGDGTYTVSTDAGITASGDLSFSANQSTDAVLNLGVDSLWFNSQISSEVGNASIMFTGGQGIKVTGDTPTANQKTYSNTSFAVDVGNGLAFNTSDQLIADLQFIENNISASGGLDEAPTDGNLYVRKGDTESWLRGLPYDISTLPALS